MKSLRLTALATAILIGGADLLLAATILANLQPVDGVPDVFRDPMSYSITEINAADGIIIGDKLFGDFTVSTMTVGGAIDPEEDAITITAVQVHGDYGMVFRGPWTATAGQYVDSTIEFHANILDEYVNQGYAFKDNTLWLTAYGVPGDGSVSVSENLYAEHPTLGGGPFCNKFVYYNQYSQRLQDERTFEPITDMWVVKDVVANGGTGSAHLSEFYQTYGQVVPEPGALVLCSMGLVGLLFFRRR